MKKLKKHAMILFLLLLLGVATLLFSSGAYAIGGFFSFSQPRSKASAAVSSGSSSSSVTAMRHSGNQLDLLPMQIGKSGTSAIKFGSASTSSSSTSSGTDNKTSETDMSGWNQGDNAGGNADIVTSPIHEAPPVTFRPISKPTTKPGTNSKTKPASNQILTPQQKPLPNPSPTPQPNTSPEPKPVTPPIQPTGNGSSGGGNSSYTVRITEVKLDKTDLTLKEGDTTALKATVSPSYTTQSKALTWSSSNEKVAVVDKTGKITAVEGGSVKITAKASNGVTGVCNVTVIVPATKVSLNLTDIDLEKGDSRILTPTVEPLDTTDSVSWATSNNDIVAVDNTGKITAVAPGTVTITATAGTVTANCKVTVGISITQIKLSETDLTVKKGDSDALSATIVPPDTTEDKAITWTSSDDKTATVDKDGNVTGIENGTAIITAQAGTHTAQCTVHVLVPATGISLDKKEINVERGTSQTLTAKIAPDDTTVTNVDWVSTDETIATVDNEGKITGVSTGSTVITVKSRDGGFTAHCTVHVVVSITGIHLSDSSLTLKKEDSHALVVAVLPADTTEDKTITWTSSDDKIATVDKDGKITAVEGGNVVITAKTGTHTAQCSVKVIVPVTGISFDSSALSIEKGASQTLTPTFAPADATDKAVSWTSSNETVATVDPSGKVSALTPGQVMITATSRDGGFKATCTIHVVISIKNIIMSDKKLTLNKNNSKALTVTIDPPDTTEDKTVHWTSSDPYVVTVDSSGNVSAVGGGTAVITATVGKHTATCNVTVVVPVTGISLDQTTLKLTKRIGASLTATFQPPDATDKGITWTSSNSDVVSVDGAGKLQAVSVGQATITAVSHDGGFRASCTVSIVIPVTGVNLNQSSLVLRKGSTFKLTATIAPANATDQAISWTTSNPGVATVDAGGNVSAVGGGTAVITTATHDGGFKAQCAVNVPIPVTGISLNKTVDIIKAGSTDTLVAAVSPFDAVDKAVTWSSSNPAVATVDQNGFVTAVAIGKATITVTSRDGGYSAGCVVTVPITWSYTDHGTREIEVGNGWSVDWGNSNNCSAFLDLDDSGETGGGDNSFYHITYTFTTPLLMHAGQTLSICDSGTDTSRYYCGSTIGYCDPTFACTSTVELNNGKDIYYHRASLQEPDGAQTYTFSSDTLLSSIGINISELDRGGDNNDAAVDVTVNSDAGSFLLNNTGSSAQ